MPSALSWMRMALWPNLSQICSPAPDRQQGDAEFRDGFLPAELRWELFLVLRWLLIRC